MVWAVRWKLVLSTLLFMSIVVWDVYWVAEIAARNVIEEKCHCD